MKKFKAFFGGITKNVWFGVTSCFNASKKYFFYKCLVLLSTTFVPLASMWMWKEILNAITTDIVGKKNTAIICLAVYLALTFITNLLNRFDSYVNARFTNEITFYIESVMMEKCSRMDLSFFDSASMGDKVSHARSNFNVMENMTWQIFYILSAVINIVAAFAIVAAYNIWIGFATVLLLAPYMVYNKKRTEKRLKMEKEQIRDNRKKEYCYNVFFDNNIQFEIKLNGIGSYFIGRIKEIWQRLYKINKREDIRHNIINAFISLVNISSEVLVIVVSIFDVINKKIGIGDLQFNLGMVSNLRSHASNLVYYVNELLVNNTRILELHEFMDIKPEIEKSGDLMPSANPKIEFCNVSFRYPNSEQYVLKDCSFSIEPHEKIGLIGLNGSGKSTIIKLMFRFYDPQEGAIKFDGVDLKEYDVYAVRKIFGVLFQDYVTYCLPLREIAALSDFGERFNEEKLKKAGDISGVSEIIKDWEQGYDSVLGRYYADNGKDLSGGQWQLVGLMRAYFKDSEYMILDEPSASLDPISEDRIFEQLYRLSDKKTSVTISHRLSNTTLADKILVIDEGHIVEQGSHFELLRQNGQYAHLFNLQASKYV
ncbi:MAG: ABC transporter ATP-binding protein/permease [Oscillospiraceae bacterium]|nr:ABC transporter ATP-binding protein/permease [Oscillospiraceae bacterium]